MSGVELDITALAAGGDGVARDETGRVTFVPRTAPGDRARVRVVAAKKSFARGELVEVVTPSAVRVAPPCEYFVAGCGGCQWQHVSRAAQLDAKQAIVEGALRKLPGLVVERIADPAPPLGWRRRARFHVHGGKAGLYAHGSHTVVPLAHCPQLEPELDAAYRLIAGLTPPDGELALVRGHRGDIVVGVQRPWRGAPTLVGRAGIVGVVAGRVVVGQGRIEIEPGLLGGPWDFAQASAAGNAKLVELVGTALDGLTGASGEDPRGVTSAPPLQPRVLELHAGAGNFTRMLVARKYDVVASDVVATIIEGARFEVGTAEEIVGRVAGPFDAIVLDPPRTGAIETMAGIARHQPLRVVYVSCDPATLARDAEKLVAAGYRADRAWPVDLMPQTSHVEVVLRLVR